MGQQIINYESGKSEINRPRQVTDQNAIQLAIKIKMHDECNKFGLP